MTTITVPHAAGSLLPTRRGARLAFASIATAGRQPEYRRGLSGLRPTGRGAQLDR